jgi:hypothetical protein
MLASRNQRVGAHPAAVGRSLPCISTEPSALSAQSFSQGHSDNGDGVADPFYSNERGVEQDADLLAAGALTQQGTLQDYCDVILAGLLEQDVEDGWYEYGWHKKC